MPGALMSGFTRPLPSAVAGPRLLPLLMLSLESVLPTVKESP